MAPGKHPPVGGHLVSAILWLVYDFGTSQSIGFDAWQGLVQRWKWWSKTRGRQRGMSLRVLVVEDELIIAVSLIQVLEDLGCECCGPFLDLATALEKAQNEPLDAAILNLLINGGPAFGVAAILKARNIPFAFASGVSSDAVGEEWRDYPFVRKPYSTTELEHVLKTLIPNHSWPSVTVR